MKKAEYIHFIGIKGVGMTALAVLAKEAGIRITGSDIVEKFLTDEVLGKAGITFKTGFSPENIEGNPDLVVVTGAHGGLDNPEAKEAQKRGLKVVSQGEAVGIFMEGLVLGRKDLFGISVAGSHGKTTTTSMVAFLFSKAGLDPSFISGCAGISGLEAPGHFGKGKYFVAEADEYATFPQNDKTPKFLWQNPQVTVITNIEYDHPDIFDNLAQIKDAFRQFIQKLPPDGILIASTDNPVVKSLFQNFRGEKISFGFGPTCDWQITKVSFGEGKTWFWVKHKNLDLGKFTLSVPGKYNALNALAAIVVGVSLGIPVEKIRQILPKFFGTKRRFEFISETNGIKLYDDYAHHPTEISATLKAAKEWFPGKRIIVIFQPHTYSRTKALFDEFARCFSFADYTVLVGIYPSAREEIDPTISSKLLAIEVARHQRNVSYLPGKEEVIEYLGKIARPGDIILTMGAGDIFSWHKDILSALTEVR